MGVVLTSASGLDLSDGGINWQRAWTLIVTFCIVGVKIHLCHMSLN